MLNVGGEFIHVKFDGNDGNDVVNCLCEHMHCVESYVHAFMTDGDRFYIRLR
jgi:hypothetical protein